MNDILLNSGYSFEGYDIVSYLGHCSGEAALGTGYFSAMEAEISDRFGVNSAAYSKKLLEAKEYAISVLLSQVKKIGGNAVIGLDIDYVTFTSDIMGVIANGTAVLVEKKQILPKQPQIVKKYKLKKYANLPFRLYELAFETLGNTIAVSLDIYNIPMTEITGVLADIKLTTIFGIDHAIEDVPFTGFVNSTGKHFISDAVKYSLPDNFASMVSNVSVKVKKYISEGALTEVPDILPDSDEDEDENENNSGDNEENVDLLHEFVSSIETLDSAKAIHEYACIFDSDHPNVLDAMIFDVIDGSLRIERSYGNAKKNCLKKIMDILSD